MKKVFVAATAALLVAVLGACGSGSNTHTASTPPASATASGAPDTPMTWVKVFEYVGKQGDTLDDESPKFELRGPSRLRYTVTATPNRPDFQGRVADIGFQDVRLDTESSRVDTIINIDDPGTGMQDLGDRDGTYFLMVSAKGGTIQSDELGGIPKAGWTDTVVRIVVEQQS
ncbi:hypothetical protein FK535_06905 [Mycolicibacterium sp. 018/SC-01/001]|uniref:hypothetical protein n=1 Tax=Mycolicibacterium sp. 018/SC-01/001 TaxID=2592069 RepID=UPI00117EA163|nr:hypothetical protein [Mycolicibacterium sp. 018/SC-01/001]TRW86197.1 hypothetical protein FK535_06905 [Mycolicibacterium sp. 018/SC-01/001]